MYNYVRILGLLFSFPVYEVFEKSVSKNKIRAAGTPTPHPLEKKLWICSVLTFILHNLTFNVYKSQKHVTIKPLISIDISILKKYQVNQN